MECLSCCTCALFFPIKLATYHFQTFGVFFKPAALKHLLHNLQVLFACAAILENWLFPR